MPKKMIVQGDVYLVEIESLPEGTKKVEKNERGYILAKGEHTGHAHVIDDDLEVYDRDGVLYIKTEKAVLVTHEEHLHITVEPGIWRVGIVQEYDPFVEETRNVQD
mgnify:CR=1 FL=1